MAPCPRTVLCHGYRQPIGVCSSFTWSRPTFQCIRASPLERRNRRIDYVYFIEVGFASVVADGSGKPSIEVGIIGGEGMTCLAIVMGVSPRVTRYLRPGCRQDSTDQSSQVVRG